MKKLGRRSGGSNPSWVSNEGFVDEWTGVRSRRLPRTAKQQRRITIIAGALVLTPLLGFGGCLGAQSSANRALRAEEVAIWAANEVREARPEYVGGHLADETIDAWLKGDGVREHSQVFPIDVTLVDGGCKTLCEQHRYRVKYTPPDGLGVTTDPYRYEAVVTVDVSRGAVTPPSIERWLLAPTNSGLLIDDTQIGRAPPEAVLSKLNNWVAAWSSNDTSTLVDLAQDEDNRFRLPVPNTPKGWTYKEETFLVTEAKHDPDFKHPNGSGRWTLLVSFKIQPPLDPNQQEVAAQLEAMENFDRPGTRTNHMEVIVLEDGDNKLPRVVGWGPVGAPSGERQ